jgi:hypothetical protein
VSHTQRRYFLSVFLASALSACAFPLKTGSARTPVRWIVVEKTVGEIVPDGRIGEGRVDPEAVVLTLQPLYSEDVHWEVVVDPHDYFVEILEISPNRQASPGETVSATVRVGHARQNEHYRLTARASQTGVRILGESQVIVQGATPTAFRFTSLEPGRAGIAVGVEKIEGAAP